MQTKNNRKTRDRHLLEIENAILKTDQQHQGDIRTVLIDELKIKQSFKNENNKIDNSTSKDLKNIKRKLMENDAIITKADKGNTTVILNKSEYHQKIDEFIINNNISILNNDPTKKYLTAVNRIITKSTSILTKQQIFMYKMIKPTAPTITGLPKLHKENTPIRPLINFTSSPSYKIAKFLNRWLNNNIKLNSDSSVKNNSELVDKIISIVIPSGAKLASFDVSNMYTNIPVSETIQIIKDLLKQNKIQDEKAKHIIELIETITQQNYFQHNDKFYTQKDGLPMGSPLSGTLANIYLNHFEKTHIQNNKNRYKNNIIYWHRYVDDIIILFHGTKRQLDGLHTYINNIHDNIKFTLEVETEKSINFLDLTIKNINHKHNFCIYRKATQTDQTIHNTSNHPTQQKVAAYNHMLTRLNSIPMSEADYIEELCTIKYIAVQNGFTTNFIHRINFKIKNRIQQKLLTTMYHTEEDNGKYIAIEYNKNTSHILNKVFRRYNYIIAHKTSHKLKNKLTPQDNPTSDSGVYKLL